MKRSLVVLVLVWPALVRAGLEDGDAPFYPDCPKGSERILWLSPAIANASVPDTVPPPADPKVIAHAKALTSFAMEVGEFAALCFKKAAGTFLVFGALNHQERTFERECSCRLEQWMGCCRVVPPPLIASETSSPSPVPAYVSATPSPAPSFHPTATPYYYIHVTASPQVYGR